jgi:nitrogen fixation-related uncharacterized protein
MSPLGYIFIFTVMIGISASAVWGLWWALKGGQMSDFQKGATTIFDKDEPIGRPTDHFPRSS